MQREVVLDTETTGLEPEKGHRLVEIGCVELYNYVPTGRVFHRYINPERDIPAEVVKVHGLTEEFLKKHPPFAHHVAELRDFIGTAPLVIHNAAFDLKFLNAEFARLKLETWPLSRATDTIKIARQKYPGMRNNLDALCARLGVDNSKREKHGALLDAELLAEVYLELMGGRQISLMQDESTQSRQEAALAAPPVQRPYRAPRCFAVTVAEKEAHAALRRTIPGAVWDALELN